MSPRLILVAIASTIALLVGPGCAVVRDQSSVGQYVDDSALTASVKARLADDTRVSALAIGVETLNGIVQLSGFAKSAAERDAAEALARGVAGVKGVRNDIIVRG